VDRIHARVEYAHSCPPEAAQARLVELVKRFAAAYPGYALAYAWVDERRSAIRFDFAKEGRGRGGGLATLEAQAVVVEVNAQFKLPFFVPIAAAEWRVRDELSRALRDVFG
jgi:hypothetical protein